MSSFSVAAFAKEYGVSRMTIYNWRKQGMPMDSESSARVWVKENRPNYHENTVNEQQTEQASN